MSKKKFNKKIWLIIFMSIFFILGIGMFLYFNTDFSHNDNTYVADRTSSNVQEKEKRQDYSQSKEQSTVENNPSPVEEQIATFSTKIYSKEAARQNNINITCSTLNNTIVKNGDTFSFCDTVGQSSSNKGYQKADIFDKNGNKKKGLGGGNCQISSTLYNAVLIVPSLVVTERHAHSNYVPYIAKGKDAAVAYGSYDFKFRNDSGHDVKILASTDSINVTTTLISIKY